MSTKWRGKSRRTPAPVAGPEYRWENKADAPAWPCCYDDCTGTQVLVWTFAEVEKVRCLACGGVESYALRDKYREHTRQHFEVEPVEPAEVSPNGIEFPPVPRRPDVSDGRIRNGMRRAA